MPGDSKISRMIGIRLPVDVYETLVRRFKKTSYPTLSDYLRTRIVYDVRRPHHKQKTNVRAGVNTAQHDDERRQR